MPSRQRPHQSRARSYQSRIRPQESCARLYQSLIRPHQSCARSHQSRIRPHQSCARPHQGCIRSHTSRARSYTSLMRPKKSCARSHRARNSCDLCAYAAAGAAVRREIVTKTMAQCARLWGSNTPMRRICASDENVLRTAGIHHAARGHKNICRM